ncbi:forespore capture DNA-binding protein RefZ [Bacillus sp. 31A1R]|uniref:Forespore capture DNA-binding protein RefZ n=1 Tax=Robertmurraya mangrovi TaxID=3098077 RepID=A0ABU5IZI6_9BACI|nr:forespore capture DNA-binding protein RefZ [Bacillus sp. 31A1R]MDZ5472532.1 forespore capture DNA-binding protein RefZ [Bacillus sp. 31A1R]
MRKNSKDAIVDSAIVLFNIKGFNGTSIRDIANKANVNVANIAYYFQNKHGLLEYCYTTFFESYLHEIERGFNSLNKGPTECLKEITKNIIHFHCQNIHLTRFILREMSIDSQVVREIMSTYFVKERYYFKRVFEEGIQTKEYRPLSVNYMIIQLKSLLSMPFLNSYYVTEVLHVFPHEPYFERKYLEEIYNWIDGVVCNMHFQNRDALLV